MFTGAGVALNKTRSRSADENEWSEHLDGFSTFRSSGGPNKKDSIAIVWHWLAVPVLLALIGLSSALLSYATSSVLAYNAALRSHILGYIPQYLQLPVFCLYCVMTAVIACFVSQLICKECVGSGLSDMKIILGGVVKPVLLSRRLIVAKTLGLWLSLMAGLSVGREGPFVQISGAIADQLMKLSPFVHIRRQDSKRLEILACACASGVSATFGNAFGGVLFSIEFTSSAYLVRTLPKAFLTTVVAMLAFLFLGVSDELSLFKGESQSIYKLPKFEELAVFFLVGLGGAFLGILFVFMVEGVVAVRNSVLDASKHTPLVVAVRRYCLVAGVTLFVSCGLYLELSRMPSTGKSSFSLLQYLFSTDSMPAEVVVTLCFFSVYKFLATVLSVTLPLPVGLFTPTFVIGGLIGRILGEVLQAYPGFDGYAPWEYALLGAAAFSTGVTRAISTSVIIFELACQPHLGLPLSVVVLTAHFVGNRFAKNIYDVLMEASGAPFLDDLPPELYTVPVGSVMMPIRDIHVLALDSTYRDAAKLLEATDASHYGSDNHASNGIYVEVTNVELELPGAGSGAEGLVRPGSTPEIAQRNGGSEHSPLLSSPRSAQYQLDENRTPAASSRSEAPQQQHAHRRRYYAPTVIPVVQSRECMVIVGAVLRKDLKEALRKLRMLSEVAHTVPVVLGRANGSSKGYGSISSYQNAGSVRVEEGETSAMDRLQLSGLHDTLAASSADLSAPNTDRQAEFLSQTIQYIIVTDDGQSIQPVVNAACVNVRNKRSLHRAVSYHTLPMAVPLDPSPYQIVDSMHLSKVDMVFRLLSLNQAYVTNSGRVVGIVTRALLRDYLAGKGRKPADRCKKFCLDLWDNFWSKGRRGES